MSSQKRRNGCHLLPLHLIKRCDLLFSCDGLAGDFPFCCVFLPLAGSVKVGFFFYLRDLVVSLWDDGCGLCLQHRQLYSLQAQHFGLKTHTCSLVDFVPVDAWIAVVN